ncbi:MAG: hypothetical protein WKF84_04290 [Pyrinomonadaceae bacterium]
MKQIGDPPPQVPPRPEVEPVSATDSAPVLSSDIENKELGTNDALAP